MAGTVRLPWNGQHWPGRLVGDLPTFAWRQAPAGLVTARQMRARGLSPAGHEHVAVIECRRGRRWARLFLLERCRPSPGATTAQLEALAKANRARLARHRKC